MAIVKYWDSVYTDEEIETIWGAIDEVLENDLWEDEENLASAQTDSGDKARRGKGFWMKKGNTLEPELCSVKRANAVLTKVFQGFTDQFASDGFWESGILITNVHTNLLSYYDSGDYYDEHFDRSLFTVISWFNREPKKYVGGDLFLPQLNLKIESKNNRLAIFPGHLLHQVHPVYLDPGHEGKGLGRFSITQFLNVSDTN